MGEHNSKHDERISAGLRLWSRWTWALLLSQNQTTGAPQTQIHPGQTQGEKGIGEMEISAKTGEGFLRSTEQGGLRDARVAENELDPEPHSEPARISFFGQPS